MTAALPDTALWTLSSTQKGAVGEAIVAAGLMLGSNGQIAPYKPLADDDGVDLLLLDKNNRSISQIQVKCRMSPDNSTSETVQFDIRKATFANESRRYILCVLLNHAKLHRAWLIPVSALSGRAELDKFVVVASAKDNAADRFSVYRHDDFESVARAILYADTDIPGVAR